MKKLSILIASLFIITGCGDDSSSGRKTTTRSGNGLNRNHTGSGCNSINCHSNDNGTGNNPFVGQSTSTPFAVGKTSGFSDNMRLGLEFYAENQQAVETLGEMEVVSTTNFGSSYCSLPVGYYDIATVNPGTIGPNTNNEYVSIGIDGEGPTHFTAKLHRSLSINLGDEWALSATLEILSVNGKNCQYNGRGLFYSFNFETQ